MLYLNGWHPFESIRFDLVKITMWRCLVLQIWEQQKQLLRKQRVIQSINVFRCILYTIYNIPYGTCHCPVVVCRARTSHNTDHSIDIPNTHNVMNQYIRCCPIYMCFNINILLLTPGEVLVTRVCTRYLLSRNYSSVVALVGWIPSQYLARYVCVRLWCQVILAG